MGVEIKGGGGMGRKRRRGCGRKGGVRGKVREGEFG